ncbi:hypothetical protein E4U35_000355 [Claviceps purpurea]|nr:hypothetical protein E4U35_000355 [Claviceps purpurea]KAG6316345.1 hypothetical protein E4U44_000766 [Claviceps purpurea]
MTNKVATPLDKIRPLNPPSGWVIWYEDVTAALRMTGYAKLLKGKGSADFHAGDVGDDAAAKAKEEWQDEQNSACGMIFQVSEPAARQLFQDYTVDEICDSRAFDGNVKYLVKWEGYPAQRHWTWEPFEHFLGDDAKMLLKKFAADNPDKPRDDRVHTY